MKGICVGASFGVLCKVNILERPLGIGDGAVDMMRKTCLVSTWRGRVVAVATEETRSAHMLVDWEGRFRRVQKAHHLVYNSDGA
ncbi:hypothetical protein FGB62_25g035 [Gracilaria domingensis]|nr:hypothetical protein FGB62_25g035 [Gracilaria domingensis]